MTATGLALFLIGLFVIGRYGSIKGPYDYNLGDKIGSTITTIGAALMLTGCLLWLWRVMP